MFVVINLIICYSIFISISMNSLMEIVLWCIVCAVLCNVIFVIEFFKTWEFKDMIDRIKFLLSCKKKTR